MLLLGRLTTNLSIKLYGDNTLRVPHILVVLVKELNLDSPRHKMLSITGNPEPAGLTLKARRRGI